MQGGIIHESSRTSIRRPVAVLMAMMIVVLLGVGLANLKLDLLPKITPPVAAVITTFEAPQPTK